MAKKRIAIDIDEVLVAHVDAFIEFSNENYGTNYTIEDYNDHWNILWGINDDGEVKRRARQFHTPESVMNYSFISGAREAILELARMYDLYIVTARPDYLVNVTKEWMDIYFSGVFKGVHFVPIWQVDSKVTKADICRQIDADYIIDDAPRHCNVAADAGVTAVLFGDYAWNRDADISVGVYRCKVWRDVIDFFDKIGKV